MADFCDDIPAVDCQVALIDRHRVVGIWRIAGRQCVGIVANLLKCVINFIIFDSPEVVLVYQSLDVASESRVGITVFLGNIVDGDDDGLRGDGQAAGGDGNVVVAAVVDTVADSVRVDDNGAVEGAGLGDAAGREGNAKGVTVGEHGKLAGINGIGRKTSLGHNKAVACEGGAVVYFTFAAACDSQRHAVQVEVIVGSRNSHILVGHD